MKNAFASVVFGLVMVIASGSVVAEGWGTYRADEYGFSMLMPAGTRFVEREYGGGWAELFAEHEGVKVYALTRLGEFATAEEIEALGIQLTGIPDHYWRLINEGANQNGWTWYRTVEASDGHTLVVGDYGTGTRGSYLIVLITSEADYRAYKSDYIDWYNSIRVF